MVHVNGRIERDGICSMVWCTIVDAGGVGGEAWSDINFIQFVCPSPWLLDGSDAGGVGGEAWTCDGQTNRINLFQFVCPSPWLLDGRGCGGVGGEAWTWSVTMVAR